MWICFVIVLSITLGITVASYAAEPGMIYVNTNGADSNDGLTPQAAKLTIQAAINAASSGDKINVAAGNYVLGGTVNVNKANIAIIGAGNQLTKIIAPPKSVGYAFNISATGVKLEKLQLEKVDKEGVQNLIYIGANDCTIKNNVIYGRYVLGDGDTSRAMEIATGVVGLQIEGNTIYALRQPAYINPNVIGNIINNTVYGTRGWVVDGANITFGGNKWGVGVNANYLDIALLPGAAPTNHNIYNLLYSDLPALSDANNNAVIEDQRKNPRVLSDVYVDANALAGGDGTITKPYKTINEGINRSVTGGTINVAAGKYVENVRVTKKTAIIGEGAATTKIAATNANAYPLSFNASGASVNGFTITHEYTAEELTAWNFNNSGVIFGQNANGNILTNCIVSLNRNGIYLNNCQGNIITNNTITNNRTGINFTNKVNGTQVKSNTISNNWTIGLVFYDVTGAQATDLSTITVKNNTFENNWYTEVLVKDTNVSLGILDVSENSFSDTPITYSASPDPSLNEPGFAAQKPDVLGIGGTATKPAADLPTLRIYNSGAVVLKYSDTGRYTINEGQPLAFTVLGAYPGGDVLKYSIAGMPPGGIFNKTAGAFSWTPDYTQSGTYLVQFVVRDDSFAGNEDVSITVNNVNTSPVLAPIGNKEINEGELLSFEITATDPDGDILTYSAANLPKGAYFNPQTRVFNWTPTYEQAGSYPNIHFEVTDGVKKDSKDITIRVNNVTADMLIIGVKDYISKNNVPDGISNALTQKLNNALKSINSGNKGAAANELKALINQIEAQGDKKLSNEQTNYLLSEVKRVILVLGY